MIADSQQPGPSRNGEGNTNVQRTFAEALEGDNARNNARKNTQGRNTVHVNQFTGITRENGIQCRFLDGSLIEDYLEATAAIVGAENIVAASKCDGHAKIFVCAPDLANTIVTHGLAVRGKYLEVTPCGLSTTNIIISGVPPFIPNEAITNLIRPFGTVVTNVRYIPLGSKKKEFRHIKSFRRQCRIRLHPGTELPYQLLIPHGEDTFTIYFSADVLDKCDFCRKIGHNLRTCRLRRQQAEAEKQTANVENQPATVVPAAGDANEPAETIIQPAQAEKDIRVNNVAIQQQKATPKTTNESTTTAPDKPTTESVSSAAPSTQTPEVEINTQDTILGLPTGGTPQTQTIMKESASNCEASFSKPNPKNPKKKAKLLTSDPATTTEQPPTQMDIRATNDSTNPLCGNAQLTSSQYSSANTSMEPLSDAETFFTDDEMDVSADFSQESHSLNSTANDINVDAAFTDAQLRDFLKTVKSQRKVFEKAEEFTEDIVGLLNSLRRYRKNHKLTQAEERSVKRVITRLSQH